MTRICSSRPAHGNHCLFGETVDVKLLHWRWAPQPALALDTRALVPVGISPSPVQPAFCTSA